MSNILTAILKINPNAQASVKNENINEITWLNGTTPILKLEIEKEIAKIQSEYQTNKYQRDRAKDYPSLADQLDMQYWDKINGTNKWQQAINAVKQKYPK